MARTGRYRLFPIAGTALVLTSVVVMTLVGTGTSAAVVGAVLILTGVGMGITWPVYVVATQNAVEPDRLGVATATLQFFRTMGGSLAVAALGALLTSRLTAELPHHVGEAAAARIDTDERAAAAQVAAERATTPPAGLARRQSTPAYALSAGWPPRWA